MLSVAQVKGLQAQLDDEGERLPLLFNALSDRTRYKIFKLLLQQHDICVTEIARILSISVPAASQQLKVLELSAVLAPERDGQRICYRVRTQDPAVRALIRLVTSATVS